MGIAVRVSGVIFAALFAAGSPSFAQDSAREREFATSYVMIGGPDETPIGEGVADNLYETVNGFGSVPEEKLAWLRKAFPVAEAEAKAKFDGTIESHLIDAFVTRFTEAELEQLLASQAFLARPEIVAIMDGELRANGAAAVEALRQTLTPEDFQKFIQTVSSPLTRAAAALTVSEGRRLSTAYRAAFDEAVIARCDTAPDGMGICNRRP